MSLAYDAIHSEWSDQTKRKAGWREQTIAWAENLVDLYVRHPWALRVSFARPVLGPNEQFVLESLVATLRATDLGAESMRRVIGLLFHAVRGTAHTIADARQPETEGERRRGVVEKDVGHHRSGSTRLREPVPEHGVAAFAGPPKPHPMMARPT